MLVEILLGPLLIMTTASFDYTCSPMESFTQMLKDTYLDGSQFYNISSSGLLSCVKECQIRRRCLSFNFDSSSGLCVLNEQTANGSEHWNLLNVQHVVHGDISDWPMRLSGSCADHTCLNTSVCRESTTVDTYECETLYCVDPPKVINGRMLEDPKTYWEVNETITYECDVGFGPVGERMCLFNGLWSFFKCLRLAHCKNVKACNRNYGDGEYWVQPNEANGTYLKVYCHDMKSDIPRNYLTLEGENYSFYLDRDIQECNPFWSGKHGGKTTFRKVKFNPYDFGIQHGDYTFAETNGLWSNFGRTGDCRAKLTCSATETGSFRIDTSGTGIKMLDNIEWTNETTVTRLNNGLVITGECFASCNLCKPLAPHFSAGRFDIEIDHDFTPDYTKATFPECVP